MPQPLRILAVGAHPDHIATGQLVAGANCLSSLPHIKTAHPPTAGPALIYYMDVHHDIRAEAAEFVDVPIYRVLP